MPRYKVFTNETAIKRVHAFFANDPPHMTHGWLDEPREIKCYIFCDDDKIEKSIILLSKCDNDPFHTHKRPLYWIGFIHSPNIAGMVSLLNCCRMSINWNKLLRFVAVKRLKIYLQMLVMFTRVS